MATVIRFARHGSKKRPFYRIVVQDKSAPRDGRFIDRVGTFDPIRGDGSATIKRDRLDYWLSVGAQMSDSVKNLVSRLKKVAAPGASDVATPAK